ncbi:MAG: ribosome maturation factor RimM [Actinomycetota bacterium]|nr:ribosome maturation factor RimM [Actinomycetota bacterium]
MGAASTWTGAGEAPLTRMEVVVGRVGRAHGVRGEVSVEVRTDEPDRRFAPGSTLRPEPGSRGALIVVAARTHGTRLLVTFEQVSDRTAAESLSGAMLLAPVDEASRPDDPEEFYDHQLVGLVVRATNGDAVGAVSRVMHLPTQDVLVVACDAGDVLVPFVAELVPSVDLVAGEVLVANLPGLLTSGSEDG